MATVAEKEKTDKSGEINVPKRPEPLGFWELFSPEAHGDWERAHGSWVKAETAKKYLKNLEKTAEKQRSRLSDGAEEMYDKESKTALARLREELAKLAKPYGTSMRKESVEKKPDHKDKKKGKKEKKHGALSRFMSDLIVRFGSDWKTARQYVRDTIHMQKEKNWTQARLTTIFRNSSRK